MFKRLSFEALSCTCAAETGGDFVYTLEELLNEEFLDEAIAVSSDPQRKHFYCEICSLQNDRQQNLGKIKRSKGHLTRKFVKECWSECGCNKKCGNRVFRRGIQVALQWRLRIITVIEYETLDSQDPFSAFSFFSVEQNHILEFGGRKDSTVYIFLLNLQLAFSATRETETMEELTWDYGIQFDDNYHPFKTFKCKCGSMRCHDKNRKENIMKISESNMYVMVA
ncbi:histone-lysine N-methyltransferase SUVR4-like [Populus alba]|uniref:histone-lysine N-methyltransferase SUVR4-like n=1 Tax=Populus alba TaxID=43335 RepID=UPI003CC73BCA